MKSKNVLVVVCLLATMFIGISHVAAAEKINTDPKQQLPDPDTTLPATGKPIKVFILMGQSNMLGFGRVGPEDQQGTLEYLTEKEGRYPHLIDDEGNWTVRNHVQYVQTTCNNQQHPLTVSGRHLGVELQFGHVTGYIHDEPVLILKACIGNRSPGWDLLPPGSEQFEFEGRIYAGYKETPLWDKGTTPEPIAWYAGKQYDTDTANAKEVLKNLVRR